MRKNQLNHVFDQLKANHKAGLIPFITAGDPDLSSTLVILNSLVKAGADIIEVGIPFSDPVADGPSIQEASLRSLEKNTSLKKILHTLNEFRQSNATTPLILMGYYNSFYQFGLDHFAKTAQQIGIDGLIIVDLPPEEEEPFKSILSDHDISLIRLITPTSNSERLKLLTKNNSGFLYYVSVTGITGTKTAEKSDIDEAIAKIRTFSDLPIAIGFGIKTAEQAKNMAEKAEAVVVGSALVDHIHKEYQNRDLSDQELEKVVIDFFSDFLPSLQKQNKEIKLQHELAI